METHRNRNEDAHLVRFQKNSDMRLVNARMAGAHRLHAAKSSTPRAFCGWSVRASSKTAVRFPISAWPPPVYRSYGLIELVLPIGKKRSAAILGAVEMKTSLCSAGPESFRPGDPGSFGESGAMQQEKACALIYPKLESISSSSK
jgi:hypothetical protein